MLFCLAYARGGGLRKNGSWESREQTLANGKGFSEIGL